MKKYRCTDCSIDTRKNPRDYYIVHDSLWEKHGAAKGWLCMDCFEKRMERKLKAEDIIPSVLTIRDNPYTRDLLLRELGLI